jgi:hypothetical protein
MLLFDMFSEPCEYRTTWFRPGDRVDTGRMVVRENQGDAYTTQQPQLAIQNLRGATIKFVVTLEIQQKTY